MQVITSGRALFPIIGLLATTSALAQEIPRYDPEAHCKKVAAFGGNYSETLNESCLDMEQSSYDQLKPVWSSLEGNMRAYCDRVAKFGSGGSYTLLQSCVEMEMKSQRNTADKKFKF